MKIHKDLTVRLHHDFALLPKTVALSLPKDVAVKIIHRRLGLPVGDLDHQPDASFNAEDLCLLGCQSLLTDVVTVTTT